ncbi:MAG TPA: hypothetical protein VGR62_15080 [Candidatus Binatia bacterium]|nr:hypothetical protein [Candidatus Binatia bacterium]
MIEDRSKAGVLAASPPVVTDVVPSARRFAIRMLAAFLGLLAVGSPSARADIPATRVMTVYSFNGPLEVPYYDADAFARIGAKSPVGTLWQGTSVIPCLVVRDGRPLVDADGTPYVGFDIVVDARRAEPADTARFKATAAGRRAMRVENHHCASDVKNVVDVRDLAAIDKPPSFDPPSIATSTKDRDVSGGTGLDGIVRAFHGSAACADAHARLIGRRAALARAWDAFTRANPGDWSASDLARARNLDYVMRTALYEGHLDRGCSPYGACERNVIALSIRNRGRGGCTASVSCRFQGDFEGVASSVSQYNVWDELLTQVSGLTSCFLRPDLAGHPDYVRLRVMYAQNVGDVEDILYGDDGDLAALFPDTEGASLTALRHYYHPPAMGKCFPDHPRVEFMTGAVARRGDEFALIAGTRIEVGARDDAGYLFREALIETSADGDVVEIADRYPEWVVDSRKVSLKGPSGCRPYGVPRGCRFERVGRYRKVPSWLDEGVPMTLTCRVRASGATCNGAMTEDTVRLGGVCDVEMQPVAGVR